MSYDQTFYVELSPDGSASRTSRGAAEWLEKERRRRLREEVADIATDERARCRIRIDGADVRIVQLRGEEETRYLATIDPTPATRRSAIREQLTDRQFEVAEYAANGATAKEIADALQISPNTVKHHLKNIYDRLGIGSRVELADHMP